MKDNEAFVGDSNLVAPPPYEAHKSPPGMVTIMLPSHTGTQADYFSHGQQQQPRVSNVNVQLSLPPLQRWPFVIGLIWLLLMIAAGVSIYVFGFLDFKNRNFPPDIEVPGSGPHFGVDTSHYRPPFKVIPRVRACILFNVKYEQKPNIWEWPGSRSRARSPPPSET